jgi:hypothetical protein
VLLDRACDLGVASRGDAFTVGSRVAAEAGARDRFRYISGQRPLLAPFRIPEAGRCFISLTVPQTLAPLMPGGTRCVPSRRGKC